VIWISLYRKHTLFLFWPQKITSPSVDRVRTPIVQQLNRELAKALNDRLDILSGLNVRNIMSPPELVNEKLACGGSVSGER
jgi:hypothetical protein